MPSVSAQPVSTPSELLKEFTQNFERRQRNLLKRKSKLDAYRERLTRGETLTEEQKKAADSYDGVVHSVQVLQEILTQMTEFTSNLENSLKQRDTQVEAQHAEYTVNFLPTLICLQRFLEELDSMSVRLAITKVASQAQLSMLDRVRSAISAPIMNCCSEIGNHSPQDACKYVESHAETKEAALCAFRFANGESLPIPCPTQENSNTKQRHWTFKDAKNLCFRLMVNPLVQRAMGVCGGESNKANTEGEHAPPPSNTTSSVQEIETNLKMSAPEVCQTLTEDRLVSDHSQTLQVSSSGQEPAIDRVIEPLKSSFNFLQVSQVGSAHAHLNETDFQLSKSAIKQDESPPIEMSQTHVRHTEIQEVPMTSPKDSCSPAFVNDSAGYFQTDPHGASRLIDEVPTTIGEVARPVSYADSVRKSGARTNAAPTRVYAERTEDSCSSVKSGQNFFVGTGGGLSETQNKVASSSAMPEGRGFRGRGRGGFYPANRIYRGNRNRGGLQRGAGSSTTTHADTYENMHIGVAQPTY